MALTVRLDRRSQRALAALAKRKRMSRSDVVREALARYDASAEPPPAGPYAAWVDVIGAVDLGVRDATRTTGEQFAALLRDDARARHPR
jgi:hypothetical protein